MATGYVRGRRCSGRSAWGWRSCRALQRDCAALLSWLSEAGAARLPVLEAGPTTRVRCAWPLPWGSTACFPWVMTMS